MSQLLNTVRKQVVSAAGIATHEGSVYYKKVKQGVRFLIVMARSFHQLITRCGLLSGVGK